MFPWMMGAAAGGAGLDDVHMTDPQTVHQWLEAGEAVLLDVREDNEIVAESIPGAHFAPLSRLQVSDLPVHDGKRLVIHCRSGNRCGMAAMKLRAAGVTETLYRMQGGIGGWKRQSLPTERGQRP